jgi:hypothetical protein
MAILSGSPAGSFGLQAVRLFGQKYQPALVYLNIGFSNIDAINHSTEAPSFHSQSHPLCSWDFFGSQSEAGSGLFYLKISVFTIFENTLMLIMAICNQLSPIYSLAFYYFITFFLANWD